MLEVLFREQWIEKRPTYSFILGIVYSLIAYGTSYVLFHGFPYLVGVSTVLFTVILTVGGVNTLFTKEEEYEAGKKQSFFDEHKETFDFFIYFFIGVFLVFFTIALISPETVISKENLMPTITPSAVSQRSAPPLPDTMSSVSLLSDRVFSIFWNNVWIMFIAFVLSLFYSSGAIFLITFNAGIFASSLAAVVKVQVFALSFFGKLSGTSCHIAVMFFHMLPEVAAYFLAAMAGGVLGKAIMKEKLGSDRFGRVLGDSLSLLLGAVGVLFIAAVIEMNLSTYLYRSGICLAHGVWVAGVAAVLIVGLYFFERMRSRKK